MTDLATAMFQGFSDPDRNYVDLPLDLITALPLIDTLAEMKVVIYVLRHTWGYREYDEGKKITLDEFEHGRKRRDGTRIDPGIGMVKNSILSGIGRAVDHGFLQVETDESDKARIEKFYSLRMFKDCTPDVQLLNPGGAKIEHRTEIDTLDKDSRSDTLFFATLEATRLYFINTVDREVVRKPAEWATPVVFPENWKTIIGVQLQDEKYHSYKIVESLPSSKQSEEPPSKVPQKVSPDPEPFVEPTIPTGLEWWFAGDDTNRRHLLEGEGKRPICKIRSFQYPNKWVERFQGAVPCEDCLKKAKTWSPPKVRKPCSALTDALHEATPEDIRPSRPHYAANDSVAQALYDQGFTPERITAFVEAQYPSYREWMKADPTRPLMSLAYVDRNIRVWEKSRNKQAAPVQPKKKDWGVEG